MQRYLLKIKYVGTNYHGWQVQPNGITVQKIICTALKQITKENVGVSGCSRTDAGVHANEFFCHFDLSNTFPKSAFIKGLNAILPNDITVYDCTKVPSDFHARYSAKGKRYIYKFFDGEIRDPFLEGFVYFAPKKIDVDLMNVFCKQIVGQYDFYGFSSSKRTVVDTVRSVTECNAVREGNTVILSITADGFLYNMVRIIAGTALYVAYGKIDPASIKEIIESKERSLAGPTLSPQGLYLDKVFY